MTAIELRGVSRRHDAGRPALVGVDLSVAAGERLAVLGPSGSGKTTILRLIAGLDRPTAGGVWFDGTLIDDVPPHRRDVGMVFQEPTLHPYLSVAGNLEFGLRARGVPRAERKARVAEVAAMLRIDGLLRRRPSALSGGERQRAAIGRSVARRPAVLLLDEPFSSLDLPLRSALRRDLVDLHDRFRMTLIHVTHDQAEALAIGDRVAVLDRGRLVQAGSPREVYENPSSPFVAGFVGSPPMNLIPCTVTRDETGRWHVVFLDAAPIALPEASASGLDVAAGATFQAWMGVRPEDIRLLAGDDVAAGMLTMEVTITRAEYEGDCMLLTLERRGTPWLARVAASRVVEIGSVVGVSIELSRTTWFRADETIRISTE